MLRSVVPSALALLAVLATAAPAAADPDSGSPAPEPEQGFSTQQADPPQMTFAYEVTADGDVRTDLGAFAADVGSILTDARSWTLGGSIAFERVSSGGDFTLVLASPQVVEDAAPVCDRQYSCRVGDRVYINDDNWRNATPAWNETGAPLWLYRQYLIDHEVGHYLGADHAECGGDGQLAPVMQQQSISLDGCEPNAWPLDDERQSMAARHDVPIYDWIFPDVLVTHTHRHAIHALADRGIVEGYADGSFRPGEDVTRAQVAAFITRALGLEADGPPPFEDVDPNDPHADAIAAVAEAGIVEGFEDGTFRPLLATSRAQMAAMIARAYGLEASGDPDYEDVPADHPHADSIAATTEAGIAEGYPDGTFRPQRDVTRGQMAAFVARAEGEV